MICPICDSKVTEQEKLLCEIEDNNILLVFHLCSVKEKSLDKFIRREYYLQLESRLFIILCEGEFKVGIDQDCTKTQYWKPLIT